MIDQVLSQHYNPILLAEKDPLEINQISAIKKNMDTLSYYTALVSGLVQKIMENSIGFDYLQHQSMRDRVKSSYFFDGQKEPRAVQWTTGSSEARKSKKGDIEVLVYNQDTYLNDKVKKLFEIMQEMEKADFENIEEINLPKAKPVLEFKDEYYNFLYYNFKSEKYIFFEFAHKKEQKKIVKKLI